MEASRGYPVVSAGGTECRPDSSPARMPRPWIVGSLKSGVPRDGTFRLSVNQTTPRIGASHDPRYGWTAFFGCRFDASAGWTGTAPRFPVGRETTFIRGFGIQGLGSSHRRIETPSSGCRWGPLRGPPRIGGGSGGTRSLTIETIRPLRYCITGSTLKYLHVRSPPVEIDRACISSGTPDSRDDRSQAVLIQSGRVRLRRYSDPSTGAPHRCRPHHRARRPH